MLLQAYKWSTCKRAIFVFTDELTGIQCGGHITQVLRPEVAIDTIVRMLLLIEEMV